MNRYVMLFRKKGNMRFLSHLDLQRLFKRVLYRADIDVAFSNGFNPHPIINIVQPLSLGIEADRDYFEFVCKSPKDISGLCERLNQAMPRGMEFYDCRELPVESKNLSPYSEYSLYVISIPCRIEEDALNAFLSGDEIIISKRDKKTKTMVPKNVKSMVRELKITSQEGGATVLCALLRCASNETLNPLNLCDALLKYCGADCIKEDIRIVRKDLLGFRETELISLFDIKN